MAGRATITFSQQGVQAPVYVVTSLSTPSWEILEMNVSEEKTAAGDSIFIRHFDHIPEGVYQYKVRIGESHWVVDETKDADTDDVGNRNNVIIAKAPELQAEPQLATSAEDSEFTKDVRQDSVQSPPLVPSAIPQEEPSSARTNEKVSPTTTGDAPEPCHDKSDIQPEDSPSKTASPSVPLIVVEKMDSEPDKVVVSSESSPALDSLAPNGTEDIKAVGDDVEYEPEAEEDRVPLFRHESFEDGGIEDVGGRFTLADIYDEDQISYGDHASLKPEKELGQIVEEDEDEVNDAVDKETPAEREEAPLLPHETLREDSYDSEVPLLPHECPSFTTDTPSTSDTSLPSVVMKASSVRLTSARFARRADQDEPDLNDPSLEPFPTDRDGIIERVATMSNHGLDDLTTFPASATALPSGGFDDLTKTSSPPADEGEESRREASISDTGSAPKNDGANDCTKRWGNLITARGSIDPLTPPMTPERTSDFMVSQAPVPQASATRHFSNPNLSTDSMAITPAPPRAWEIKQPTRSSKIQRRVEIKVREPSTSSNAQPPSRPWLVSIFAAIGRLFAKCFGSRNRATSGAILVLGVAVAAYYFMGFGAQA